MSHLLPSLPPSHTKSGCREPRPQLPNRMSACQRPELCPIQGKGRQRKATRGKDTSQKHTHTQWALIHHSTVGLTAREHPRRPPSWNQLEHCQLQFWKGASWWLTLPMSAPPTIPTLLDLLPPCLLHPPPQPSQARCPGLRGAGGGRAKPHAPRSHARMDRYLRRRCRSRWEHTWPLPPGGHAPCRCPRWPGSAGRRPE